MKKQLFVLLALVMAFSMILAACKPADTAGPGANTPVPTVGPKVQIRWFVGLGTGTDPVQVEVQQALVDKFNTENDRIELVLEVVPYDSAKDTLATQIAAGAGPDIIGPVGWGGSNAFYGQWLDLTPYLGSYDAGNIDPALIEMYQTEEGQVGLPFLVFPASIWYNPAMFDEAGLAYPPAEMGGTYTLDGAEVEWNWETVAEVAKRMTLDVNGVASNEAGFDATQIVQVGYHPTWSGHPAYLGAYWGASPIYSGEMGSYVASIPAHWVEAWQWYYDGIWGDQPYISNGALSGSAEFGTGNTFSSGRVGMTLTNLWYTCCLNDFRDAGNTFQFGSLPAYNGQMNGRVDADTFRVWKGTKNPAEAFEVLTYLIGPVGTQYLVVGADGMDAAYGGFPALPEYQQPFLDAKAEQYPFVTTWDTILAGLAYPDAPSAEGYMPNWNEAWNRIGTLGDLMQNTDGLDLAAEVAQLEADLTVIFNR